MTFDFSISQRLLLSASLEGFKERNMSQKDRDEIEKLQIMLQLNLPGGKFGVKKVREQLV